MLGTFCCNHFIPVHARITRTYSHMLQDNKSSIFRFLTWRPTRGRGLHSFESFSFVIIALSRFISYHGRRKEKVGWPAGKTWRTSNRRNKNKSEARTILEPTDLEDIMWSRLKVVEQILEWKAKFTCGNRRGDYKNMFSWSYRRATVKDTYEHWTWILGSFVGHFCQLRWTLDIYHLL